MNPLKKEIEKLVGVNPEHLETVLACFEKSKLKRNEILFEEGDICKYIYFVENGLIQVMYTDKNGIEKTTDLIFDNNWFTDLESFKNRTPSNLKARATKSTIVYKIGGECFQEMMHQVPKFAAAYLSIIESKYEESTARIIAFSGLNAQDRIEWLYRFKPEFLNHVSDKLIASYLGISKETYCRQKKIVAKSQ